MPSLGLGLGLHKGVPTFTGLLDYYTGAAAAYSLRALSRGWLAGDVVEVRRDSDSATADFTASQVANGTLVDWVKRCGDFTNAGFTTLVNNGTGDGFTATLTSGEGQARSPSVSGGSSDVVVIDFDIDIVSGSPALALRSTSTVRSNLEIITTSGSKSITLTATGNFNNFTFSEADIPSEYTISNVRVSTNDGFVSKWYDQSGNGNDATQATTTSQPKIVDAGALVTGGLDFYSNSSLDSAAFADGSDSSVFLAFNNQTADANRKVFISKSTFPDDGIVFNYRGDVSVGQYDFVNYDGITRSLTYSEATSPLSGLSTTIINGTGKEAFLNGTSRASDAETFVGGSSILRLGSGNFGTGFEIAEVILYPTDESANRVGIETNINDAYNIF